jgi:hypothetical protein
VGERMRDKDELKALLNEEEQEHIFEKVKMLIIRMNNGGSINLVY